MKQNNRPGFFKRIFVRPARAFTLVELLIVIAILAMLAFLIMSTLGKGKNRAIQMIDVNNLKQIITAVHLYANENADHLPWPNWKSGDYSGRPGWLYSLDSSAYGPAQYKITNGLIWPDLRSRALYLCPLDNTNDMLFNLRRQQLSSYAMNGAVAGFDRTNFPAARLGSMRPDDIAFWETDENQSDYFNDGANFPAEGVSGRHLNGAINAAFGGSVTYVRLGVWYLQVYDPNRNSLWCYPGSTNGR